MDLHDPRHGSYAGASEHRKTGAPICVPCLRAERIEHALTLADRIAGQPRTIPALGTIRRIQALQAIGWTIADIARQSGLYEKTLRNPIYRGTSVYRATAQTVAETYERLCMTIPEGGYHERCRRMAANRRYVPPLGWNDIDNDEQPTGVTPSADGEVDPVVLQRILGGDWRLPCTPAEKTAVCETWTARGGSLNDLGRLTGWRTARYMRKGEAA